MNFVAIAAAAVAGIAGSAHCGVMCGGIAAALGSRTSSPRVASAARGALGFNLGRLLGYALVGAALELIVQTFGGHVPGAHYGSVLRIAAAVWMTALAVRLLLRKDLLWVARAGAWCGADAEQLAPRVLSAGLTPRVLSAGLTPRVLVREADTACACP